MEKCIHYFAELNIYIRLLFVLTSEILIGNNFTIYFFTLLNILNDALKTCFMPFLSLIL